MIIIPNYNSNLLFTGDINESIGGGGLTSSREAYILKYISDLSFLALLIIKRDSYTLAHNYITMHICTKDPKAFSSNTIINSMNLNVYNKRAQFLLIFTYIILIVHCTIIFYWLLTACSWYLWKIYIFSVSICRCD